MSSGMSINASQLTANNELFTKVEEYPWDADEEFKQGLHAILRHDPSPEQARTLTLKARCFYYSRQDKKFDVTVDSSAYEAWQSSNVSPQSTAIAENVEDPQISSSSGEAENNNLAEETANPSPPYPLTFNRIVELITTGQAIPGVKTVPDTVLEGQSSEITRAQRKKPWETKEDA